MNTLLKNLRGAIFACRWERIRKLLRNSRSTIVLMARGLHMGLAPAPIAAALYLALALLLSAMPVAQVWLGKVVLTSLRQWQAAPQ